MNLKEIKKHITISNGNIKTGKIPSISLPPVLTCRNNAPCAKDCYALKAWRLYPSVKQAWSKNFDTYQKDHILYFSAIQQWLIIKKPKYFRWHVSGDIPNKQYLNGMISTAKSFKDIKFLAFTKKYDLLRYMKNIPENLSIVVSAWPKLKLPKTNLPIAYMQDGNETRTKNAIECPGNCERCGMCWNLKYLGKNVVFNKH